MKNAGVSASIYTKEKAEDAQRKNGSGQNLILGQDKDTTSHHCQYYYHPEENLPFYR